MPSENKEGIRLVTLGITIAVLALVVGGLMIPPQYSGGWNAGLTYDTSKAEVQNVVSIPWIPSFKIDYFLALDGISFPLVALTAFISFLAMWASWSINKHVKAYCILFLLLETGMIGVFMTLDFFLFYVFWEVMLLPMYFLIGIWGGPRKEYAAIKFFLYTLLGGVLMLIAILMLYFNSDLRGLSDEQLIASHVVTAVAADQPAALKAIHDSTTPVHTFNILALQQIGQTTEQLSPTLQWWCFLLLFIGFAIKVPSIPVHTWLPDAHVEAPTPISMILAGVLLKMGGYGIIRICYPICPHGGYELMWFVCGLGVASMIYGAFAALAQKDFKRMVAYSSVSHMGYVVLGLGVWSARAYNGFNPYYWDMGIQGAMFQMIGHGVSSAGMFFMVGIVYDRVHHRNLEEFGGLFGKMPYYTAMAMGIFFAGLGLPGLCGFPGEFFVVMSVWKFSPLLAILSALVVIFTAGYILWAVQRVYLGAEYKGPHKDHLTPSNFRENAIGTTLLVFAILFGVFPDLVLRYMNKTIDRQTKDLAAWTATVKEAQPAAVGRVKTEASESVAAELPGAE
jgi:NADH-quinone oxidoreductase subunit M